MSTQAKILVSGGLIAVLIVLGASDAYFIEGELTASLLSGQTQEEQKTSVLDVLNESGFGVIETDEVNLLAQILPEHVPLESRVLMQNDDRAAFVTWTGSFESLVYFLALKEVLHSSFSEDVSDLLDELRGPPENSYGILTFLDPKLSDERFVFVHFQNRLLEFHIVEGKEDTLWALIDSLTAI